MRLKCVACGLSEGEPFKQLAPYLKDSPNAMCETCKEGMVEIAYNREPTLDFREAETFATITSPRYVGVEFEMFHYRGVTDRSYQLATHWRLANCGTSEDGSIDDDSGIEIKTPPTQGDDTALWVHAICRVAAQFGMRVDKSCGLHVHTDAHDLTTAGLRRLLLIAHSMEPIIYGALPGCRWDNGTATPMKLTRVDIEQVRSRREVYETWGAPKNGGSLRYKGINLAALEKYGTIEYRYHSGTLNPTKVLNWVRLCLAMTDAAHTRKYAQIPAHFTDFDDRLTTMLRFLQIGDLYNYLQKRITAFGHNVQALHDWASQLDVPSPSCLLRAAPSPAEILQTPDNSEAIVDNSFVRVSTASSRTSESAL